MNTRLSPQDFIQANSKTLMDLFGKEEPAYSEKEVLWLMENYDAAPSGEGEAGKAPESAPDDLNPGNKTLK